MLGICLCCNIMANLDEYHFVKENKFCFRIVWLHAYLILTGLSIGLIVTLWGQFLLNPTVTSLETSYHPIEKIVFPGVAICNINKISRREAQSFANYVANHTKTNFSEAFKLAKFFGNFYDFDFNIADEKSYKQLQSILDGLQLDVATLMKQFTTRCQNLLIKCRWKGVIKNCEEIFKMELTYDGFCCTFNYVKESLMNESLEILNGTEGLTRGLSITVINDLEDYFYTSLESQGVTVQIFAPSDYPDKPSGGLSEVVVQVGTENFLKITPTTVFSAKEVMKYPVSKRQCLFDEERVTTFEGIYSQSDCNVDCRIASALALCQCLPFTIPLDGDESVCTFQDLQCLNQYKNKWNTLYPETDNFGLLQHEQHDSLRCQQRCYPSCDATLFEVLPDSSPVHNMGNYSIIHIYYANRFSKLFKHDVVYYWFEILSNFGGTFGIIVGFSVISVTECLVFMFQFTKKKCFA